MAFVSVLTKRSWSHGVTAFQSRKKNIFQQCEENPERKLSSTSSLLFSMSGGKRPFTARRVNRCTGDAVGWRPNNTRSGWLVDQRMLAKLFHSVLAKLQGKYVGRAKRWLIHQFVAAIKCVGQTRAQTTHVSISRRSGMLGAPQTEFMNDDLVWFVLSLRKSQRKKEDSKERNPSR